MKDDEKVKEESTAAEPEAKPITAAQSSKNMVFRFVGLVVNLFLFSAAVNPSVPAFVYYLAGVVGVGYVFLSDPVSQDGKTNVAWDAERRLMRSLTWQRADYTKSGYAFFMMHNLMRAIGSLWLFLHCVLAAYGR